MFGHDPRLPLTELFQHKLRYLGTDETVLSLQALRNMHLVIAENLRKARERNIIPYPKKSAPIQQNQLVTLKVHIRKTLDPPYEGTYRVIRIKGNQVELARNGTVAPTKWAHISHLKPLLRADEVIEHLPKDSAFARKTKLALNPDKIPDLDWKRATELNTPTSSYAIPYQTFQVPPNILKEGEGDGRRMKREGEEEEVWWSWERKVRIADR